jgi:hypothetical protein
MIGFRIWIMAVSERWHFNAWFYSAGETAFFCSLRGQWTGTWFFVFPPPEKP